MELETFFTEVYVVVDDWYKQELGGVVNKHVGGAIHLSDSEVLTLALVGQWRVGVPWQSERGLVRWVQQQGRGLFPQMIGKSAFNQRVRGLWGAFIYLQQRLGAWLESRDDLYECVDGVPIHAFSNSQGLKEAAHGLWESQRGHGGTAGGFFSGDKVLMSVTASEVITGWLVGNGDINERWLLEAFLSARSGQPQLVGPAPSPHASRVERATPPVGHIGAFQAVGLAQARPYLADRGFNSRRWRQHWAERYAANVISVPPRNDPEAAHWSPADCRWLASHRQIIDTTFAFLSTVFGFQHPAARSRWGLYTRLAAKVAAFSLGIFLNRQFGRPLHALATLLS